MNFATVDLIIGFKFTSHIEIDNLFFRLHSKITFFLYVFFAILSFSDYFYDIKIKCLSDPELPSDVVESYCLINSTYIILEAPFNNKAPYPGVDHRQKGEIKLFQNYYQWVWSVLLIQAVCFYIPRAVWKRLESKRMVSLVGNLDLYKNTAASVESDLKWLVGYFVESKQSDNTKYFVSYFICEVLNLLNAIFQIFLTDRFLGGAGYGINIVREMILDEVFIPSPTMAVFPRMENCTYYRKGYTGKLEQHDVLCTLPLNGFNYKIYTFLFVWLYFLAIASTIVFLYRVCVSFYKPFRLQVLYLRSQFCNYCELRYVLRKNGNIGFWFQLCLLSKNLDPKNFGLFIKSYSDHLCETVSDGETE